MASSLAGGSGTGALPEPELNDGREELSHGGFNILSTDPRGCSRSRTGSETVRTRSCGSDPLGA